MHDSGEPYFVDTSAWYDYVVPGQQFSKPLARLMDAVRTPLITSDFILDELFTLLKARNKFDLHATVWATVNNPIVVSIIATTRADLDAAYAIYSKFSDKDWSFTDCLSYHFIRSLKIKTALSLDHHFHEFGIVTVLP